MRLLRYLSFRFFALAVTATLMLAAIAEVLDLVDNAGDILDRGEGAAGFVEYLSLRTPTLIAHSLPLGALVGALAALAFLARNSEIVAMRAAGRSSWELFALMVPGAFVLAVAQCALLDVVLPKTQRSLAVWWAAGPDSKIDSDKPAWLRLGDQIISFEGLRDRGRTLVNLKVYDRDAEKVAIGRTTAAEARYEKRRWTLIGATHTSWLRESFNVQTPADGPWKTTLTPADAVASLTPGGLMSSDSAQQVLAGERVANAPPSFYATLIQRVYAGPMGVAVLLLLAMPAAFLNWRDARSARYVFVGLALGLAFLLTDGLLTSLGGAGVLSPVVGAWSGVILFAIIGAFNLFRMERGLARPRPFRAAGDLLPEPSR
ncbi:LptF/LptG family permease [Methylopila turkensis]|uniref:LPS export ABC transporter permease LptG n=1 Tax=Methylopila turkensis TaxID=1437816 RepID=A0A9W6N6J7_9HYPH|nr:LptF/LptG family permease [Methylopila turkensis]GLK80319.1 hypothetical protein GCM10008174_20600 [Methylopila turkensis]